MLANYFLVQIQNAICMEFCTKIFLCILISTSLYLSSALNMKQKEWFSVQPHPSAHMAKIVPTKLICNLDLHSTMPVKFTISTRSHIYFHDNSNNMDSLEGSQ